MATHNPQGLPVPASTAVLVEQREIEELWQVVEGVCHLPLPKAPDHCHFHCVGRLTDLAGYGMVYEHAVGCPSVVAMHLMERRIYPAFE